ncbi:hypothetical protein QFC20_005307 [Naganishia adeliensis]|uniref:Uncharacterized protein n=1 Tax=Naganishia adeliensis TaxID=92952 RepID=A0ACC2VPC3_9TREE|nr:hypothetical protein QFC20_005307 [Naganishia adeliensis]
MAGERTEPIDGYYPKIWLSCIGIACYGLCALGFWFRFFRSGKPKYMLTIAISTTTMTIGFVIRIIRHNNISIGVYCAETMFILLSPCGFLAQDYVLVPRLASYLGYEEHLYKAHLVVKFFIWSDVVTFLLQAGGGGMSAIQSMANTGKYLALIGLILQLISFLFFCTITVRWGFLVHKHERGTSSHEMTRTGYTSPGVVAVQTGGWKHDWRYLYASIFVSMIGFIIRSFFRIVEYAQGYDGYLRGHEGYFYLLDALPLLVPLAIWVPIWPPQYIGNNPKSFSRADEIAQAQSRYSDQSVGDLVKKY